MGEGRGRDVGEGRRKTGRRKIINKKLGKKNQIKEKEK